MPTTTHVYFSVPFKKLHPHRPQTVFNVFKHKIVFALALFTDKKRMSWTISKAHAACITRGPEKGGLGTTQRYTMTPRGRALYKDPGTGKCKKMANYTSTGKPDKWGKQKDSVQMRGEALRQTRAQPAKVTTRTADKGTAKPFTKTSTKADKSGHRTDKGAAKDHHKDQRAETEADMADKVWRRGQSGLKADAKGQKADTWRTRFGGAAKADSRQTQGDTWRTRLGGAAKENSRPTHGGQSLGGPKADTWRTQGGHMADKVWRRGQSGFKTNTRGHMADKAWRRGQRELKADTCTCLEARPKRTQFRWTQGGQGVETRPKQTQGGHKVDTWRTSSGDASQGISRPAFLS